MHASNAAARREALQRRIAALQARLASLPTDPDTAQAKRARTLVLHAIAHRQSELAIHDERHPEAEAV